MGLSTAERNKRKRERKKREKEERRKREEAEAAAAAAKRLAEEAKRANGGDQVEENDEDIEIEYYVVDPVLPVAPVKTGDQCSSTSSIPDGLPPGMKETDEKISGSATKSGEDMGSILRKFNQRAAVAAVVTDDEYKVKDAANEFSEDGEGRGLDDDYDDDYDGNKKPMSKRKLREITRPTVAELKRRVKRPDLVEAHDITAADPDFLIHLKGIPGTVPVPRHWGRKRKYLQGKRGFEKPPFKLPDFIVKTGITEMRDTLAEDEASQSAKQKNRSRVNPKMGAMDVDYKTLYEAFFKFQTKPPDMTKFGDLYYEGKELETSTDRQPGGPYSKELREALGMIAETAPPPWLINMQRYGPPPSYPSLSIPGLNAPLPNDQCQYGYHTGGWGKPQMDAYGRALYGGNPFDPPGSGKQDDSIKDGIVTSDGKTISKSAWGMPAGHFLEAADEETDEESTSEEESSEDDMEESEEEEDEVPGGMESVLPPQPAAAATAPVDLRKQTAGDETPMSLGKPKQLYRVLEQTSGTDAGQQGGVFQSDVKYMLPGASSAAAPDGAASVLSKAIPPSESAKRKRKHDEDEDGDLGKNFKF